MKIILSELIKNFLPDLTVSPKEIGNALTYIGHFTSGINKIGKETVFDLEIRQNRGDCNGYYGIAQDLSVYFDTPFKPSSHPIEYGNNNVDIQIKSADVKRIVATTISDIKNSSSPKWLVDFLFAHQINSINTLVDLTNYITLLYGIPCHAFDTRKSTPNLIWENNNSYPTITTLDGSTQKLHPNCLIISNPKEVLSLSFLGGKACAVDLDTNEIILEMAIYNPTRVRKDARILKIITEASIRLEKDLDTELIPMAITHLIDLIKTHCHGQITGKMFDYYPTPWTNKEILFDPNKPSMCAGIEIDSKKSMSILEKIGCQTKKDGNKYLVTVPSFRKDVEIEEDLTEEVIRFYGYQKIPTHEPLKNQTCPDITPQEIKIIDSLRAYLSSSGFDEVRSWPLVQEETIDKLHEVAPLYKKVQIIRTQNNINELYPNLRPSLIASLLDQVIQYRNLQMPEPINLFEIGKVFYHDGKQYREKYSLGIFSTEKPKLKLNLEIIETKYGYFSEIDIDKNIESQIPQAPKNQTSQESVVELKKQFTTLDANVSINSSKDILKIIASYQKKLGKHLWSLKIIDKYEDTKNNSIKYTFQACYFNLDSDKAKKLHLKTFKLI